MKLKILALILARKNSKRLKKKTYKRSEKKWSIESVKKVDSIVDILVSTDDKKIIEISKKNGALAPWQRPSYLSQDETSSESSALHALNWYEKNKCKVDAIILIQPTTPFRSKENIKKAIKVFKENAKKSVVSVSTVINKEKFEKPRINGSFYLVSKYNLKKYKNFSKKNFYPILIKKKEECIDIDNKDDLDLAKKYYKNIH